MPIILKDISQPQLFPFESLWRKGRSDLYFVAEGFRFVELALQSPLPARICLATSAFAEKQAERWASLKEQAPLGLPFVLVSERIFARFASTKSPQGVLAILDLPPIARAEAFVAELPPKGPFSCFVLEKLQDPGNVGSIVRTVEALGYDALFYTTDSANPFSPKALRAAMGSTLFLPVLPIDSIADFLTALKARGILSVAAALHGEELKRVAVGERLAILVGNEGEGLSAKALAGAEKSARIPMCGRADSLNAAAAAAIMAFALKGD